MSETERVPKIGDPVYFTDGETSDIIEVIGPEDDTVYDVSTEDDNGDVFDAFIRWNNERSRWEVDTEYMPSEDAD